ncbi:MAG: GntR family transcriptional regulator [Chitinispirillaceae bacterium]|nr:GntR family transcriptional regulator [Chitinispirillaceae bacterium]
MEKTKPGIARACTYLATLAMQKENNISLPPIRSLARSAGVSFVTMWKALQRLQQEQGIVVDNKGNRRIKTDNQCWSSGRRESASASETTFSKGTTGSWRHIAEKLYRDIVSGRYTGGEKLPSCKELQQSYGVSFATLKKALASLINEEIVEPHTNGYYIPLLTGSTGHARIVAIACGWEDGKIWVDHQDKSYFRALESECIRMNIQLDVIVYFRSHDRLRFVHTASKTDYDLNDRTILGYIFIVANLDSAPEEVLERLVGMRRNVAVLDVVGGWKVPRCAQGSRLVQFFTTTASMLPAKRVAQYLLGRGHRRIAFFSPFHRALWSQRRLDTITEMFDRAGFPRGVIPFVQNGYAYQWDYLKNQEHDEDIRSLINQYAEWKKEAHAEFFKRFGNLGYSIAKYITEWNCASGEIYEKMKPLFEKALDNRTITAWVMANDFAATIAIDFLKEHKVRIPDDLSVISFDNTLDAMEYQLTSYDFNNHGIITMMLRFIVASHTIKPARHGGCIEVDGTLVVRRSTSSVAASNTPVAAVGARPVGLPAGTAV